MKRNSIHQDAAEYWKDLDRSEREKETANMIQEAKEDGFTGRIIHLSEAIASLLHQIYSGIDVANIASYFEKNCDMTESNAAIAADVFENFAMKAHRNSN